MRSPVIPLMMLGLAAAGATGYGLGRSKGVWIVAVLLIVATIVTFLLLGSDRRMELLFVGAFAVGPLLISLAWGVLIGVTLRHRHFGLAVLLALPLAYLPFAWR